MSTTWTKLLTEKRVAAEPTSKQELDEIREMIDVNLQDAQVTGLSAQGRFEFAYNAARQTATLAIRATGCRSKRNDFSYDSPITVTETEANDLFNTAKQLLTDAEAWILVNHPSLA